jgi:hypothetical protein
MSEQTAMKKWSDEQIALMVRLRAQGYSAADIASEIPGASRNSVLGVFHRLLTVGKVERKTVARSTKSKEFVMPERPPEDPRTQALWMTRRFTQCAHLLNDPLMTPVEEWTVCGAPTKHESSYCRYHHLMFYQPPTRSKRHERPPLVRRFAKT